LLPKASVATVTNGKLLLPEGEYEGEYEGEIVGGKANGNGKITFRGEGKNGIFLIFLSIRYP